jgi:hypothetical protein
MKTITAVSPAAPPDSSAHNHEPDEAGGPEQADGQGVEQRRRTQARLPASDRTMISNNAGSTVRRAANQAAETSTSIAFITTQL